MHLSVAQSITVGKRDKVVSESGYRKKRTVVALGGAGARDLSERLDVRKSK